MEEPDPFRFSAEVLYHFSIDPSEVKYALRVNKEFKDDDVLGFFSSPKPDWATPPPYIVGIVSELINQREIPKYFHFTLQYVTSGTGSSNRDNVAISYDVVFAGEKALRSATFEVLSKDDCELFFENQLQPIFEEVYPDGGNKEVSPWMRAEFPWLYAGFIDHEIEIIGYEKSPTGGVILKSRCRTTFRRAPYGEYASTYILPRFPKPNGNKMWPVALACYELEVKPPEGPADNGTAEITDRKLSPIMQQNLEALELGMSVSTPKIVFIQGEPGSGKEGFATAIHSGSRIDERKGGPKFSARSVAGMNLDQFKREVLGEEKDGAVIQGLIDKCRGGTIFLDEFDKLGSDADSTYAELLRVWESGEFVPVNARSVRETDGINWIVAGAFTSTRSTSDLPQDIWSRFSTQIAIQNPISSPLVSDDHCPNYIQGLIFSFMLGLGLSKCNQKEGWEKSLQALCRPRSRIDRAAHDLLFTRGQNVNGERLQPSALMICVSEGLSRYLGTYSVFSLQLRANDRNTKEAKFEEYCLPGPGRPSLDGPSPLNSVLPVVTTPPCKDRYLPPFEVGGIDRCHDSVRAVRQACRVVFDRLFELRIQRADGVADIGSAQIRKLMNEAFTTIDLTRRGNGLERLLCQEDLGNLRFGEKGVLPERFLSQIARAAQEV
ncbi:MAG: sigma-54 factor interaction domain-containing protein [Alphaproteobacteria bacterium]|nr:MAG: sigma-54 factor interaction domain-containing protein [Alphaproteobacteria bacterium]